MSVVGAKSVTFCKHTVKEEYNLWPGVGKKCQKVFYLSRYENTGTKYGVDIVKETYV